MLLDWLFLILCAFFVGMFSFQHRAAGNTHFKENRFPEAKKEYDEAIRRNPRDPLLYANRAAALIKLMELPMALKV